jgi:hypothetical protein
MSHENVIAFCIAFMVLCALLLVPVSECDNVESTDAQETIEE